ncbi:MAG: transposase [Phycisphaerales bacterium]|nr:transposase [Phycisphaerales bacterium]
MRLIRALRRLDEESAERGIGIIAPVRSNRRPENKTLDGRPLRRYKRRWKAERTIAWIENFRRLCVRYEKSTMMFKGFVQFGCAMLLLREVWDSF